jgi:undecaprenyl-diphosphatase
MVEALILGIVQGLTEFLPISSTAHLILFPWFFNWGGMVDTLTFDIALHAGTLLALLLVFWREWLDIFLRKRRLLLYIVVATIPAGVLGKLFNDVVESKFRSPLIICSSLVAVGIVMLLSERMFKHKKVDDITMTDAVIIGISQAVALVPGVSRSGITISAGLFRGIERESAARFSFLLSTPVIAGAVLLHLGKMITAGTGDYNMHLLLTGVVASAVTGFVAIKFLLSFFRRHSIDVFAYYRIILAVVIIIGIWLKR